MSVSNSLSLPDFYIIGAMKCGTSTLHDQLAHQGGFYMSTPKEPNFFSDDEEFQRGMAYYLSLFEAAPPGSLKGESSTHYTKLPTYPHTVDRLAAATPQAKFIYVMRHPVHRLVSHYIHEWTMGVMADPIDACVEQFPALVDYGRYAYQLRPWVDAFGRESILPVFFEAMLENPQGELDRIGRFLGVQGTLVWREDQAPQNVSSERIRRFPLYSLLVDNSIAAALRRMLVPKSFRDRIKGKLQMTERPEMSDVVKQKVVGMFDADLLELSQMLDARLDCECFSAVARAGSPSWRA